MQGPTHDIKPLRYLCFPYRLSLTRDYHFIVLNPIFAGHV